MNLFIISTRSRLVSQPKNKLISNSEQLFNATDLSPITFGVILPPNPKDSITLQIKLGTLDEKINSKVYTFKIIYSAKKNHLVYLLDLV